MLDHVGCGELGSPLSKTKSVFAGVEHFHAAGAIEGSLSLRIARDYN
jgi:hypothetical protein